MRLRIPNEIVASILAATTAFIGGNAANLPVWAIFVGWAATYLAGGPVRTTFVRLYPAMIAGATFALVIVLLDSAFQTVLGSGQTGKNVVLALAILVVNTLLMYSGRTRLLALIPGMFLGFASYFATMFGGFGFVPSQPFAAWVSVVAMLALGPVFALIAQRVAARAGTAEQQAGPTTVTDARPAGSPSE